MYLKNLLINILSKIGNKKKQQNKLIQSMQSLACALEQEKEKTEELEKEFHG